jgi:hypothetical protein
LTDITLANDYANLLGYTQSELEYYFDDYIKRAALQYKISKKAMLHKIKIWYDEHSWDGVTHLYNPYGTLNFLNFRQFKNY